MPFDLTGAVLYNGRPYFLCSERVIEAHYESEYSP
jgi:hypothetical protein